MHWFGWVAVVLYAAAEALAIRSLFRSKGLGAAPALVAAGLVAQFADLELVGRSLGSVPYRTLGGSIALFAWMLGLAYLALVLRHRERAIGPFLIPFVLAFSVLGIVLPSHAPSGPATRGSLFAFHVTLAILADAAFALSVALGVAWARRVWSGFTDAKLIWALLTLFVYGVMLWMDRRGWEGPRVALLSIFGFLLVLFSYTFVNLYLSQAHVFR